MKHALRSRNTTIAAALVAASALLAAIAAEVDGNSDTVAQWGQVIPMVIAAVGLFFAKDSDK